MPTGFGLRPGCESAGRATESLPVTRLPSTLHESCRYPGSGLSRWCSTRGTTSRWTASTTVPVDARLERDVDVRFETVTPDDLLVRRQGRRCGWSSLDACRNNPLARSMRAPPATRTVSGGQLRGTGRGPPGGRAAGPDEGLHRSRSATPATDSAPSFPAPARSCRGRVPVGKPSPVPAPIPHRVAAARSGRPRSAVAGHRHRLPR